GETIVDPSAPVKPGQIYLVSVPEAAAAEPIGQDIPLDILYEDKDLVVINKTAGMVVHPAAGNHDGTLVNALIYHCGDSLSGIGGVKRPGIVHRLDKDTSGVMVVAKNDAAHAGLVAQFLERTMERAYQGLVWGLPQTMEGRIEGNIGRSPRNRKKMALLKHGGRFAATHYKVLRVVGTKACLVECRLETGRTHQIRVHMSSIGHSVVGDPLYGGRKNNPTLPSAPYQALHAYLLGFVHPTSGEKLRFEAPLTPYFNDLLAKLEAM
ncbi:MAG: RluA family pseudouridine synthase, partial [Rhodospirillales bacterium]|nr:RluA family pseudouridine synthase [Rhodospirillales bacterium]